MAISIRGGVFSLYVGTDSNVTTAWNSKVKVGDVNVFLPYYNGTDGLLNAAYNLINNGALDSSVASSLDAKCPYWQQYSMVLIDLGAPASGYVTALRSLFPNHIDLTPYVGTYKFAFLWDERNNNPSAIAFQLTDFVSADYAINSTTGAITYTYDIGPLATRPYRSSNNTGTLTSFCYWSTATNTAITTYWSRPTAQAVSGFGTFKWPYNVYGNLAAYSTTKDNFRPPTDPYEPGGYSGTGGGPGTGTFDLDSDVIGLPPIPTLSFASTGFTRIYNPSLSELNALANYLWTDQTFLDTVINHLKQLLENPMDAVISLSLLPCSIPNGSPEAVKVMYINTGVSMAPATTQFVDVDCGTYTIEEFYGSALDYNPYTKVHCYLPYIGQVTLDTDEVMGKTLNVVYRIDIVTGMCAAMILVDQNVLYQFSGHCAINMPINSADFSGYIGAAMTAGKMVAGVVAGASGNLPLAGELIGAPAPKVTSTSQTTETVKSRNPKTGRQVTQWSDTKARETTATGASFGEMTRKAISNSVSAVMGSKLTVEHAGGFTGNSGYLAVRRPYLIIERPRMCNPEEYGRYNGRPSMIYMNLGECVGYTEVQSIQFENIPATNPELAELSELLKSGVLF